ncbi:uncharacterized protein LOC115382205 isoform X4 [Salarias fasciatus]|uniref:uncharacterized protein LOC115382205 isoform X4 n=1 Tax=Salarias fasciatus TaxID=181472 RepID=UPI001176CEB7|nr:uncharacterized protein LOC115382205 isoform X4 [Salarias fasciatus]
MCITATIRDAELGQADTERFFRGCATSSVCPTIGEQTFSMDLGVASVLASARCCDTDDCNVENLPAPDAQTDNGGQCFACFPGQSDCQLRFSCAGVEDRCFEGEASSSSGNFPTFGCISQTVCDAAPDLGDFTLLDNIGQFTSGPTCCQGNLCNDGTISLTTTAAAPTTTPLQCLSCSDDSCSSPVSVPCSAETMCITATIRDAEFFRTTETQRFFRGCATSSVCPTIGEQTFSMDLGSVSVLASARCCDTDDCNVENLPAPDPQTDNGGRCFICFPGQSECQSVFPCAGVEDRCFQGEASSGSGSNPAFGCISQTVCDAAPDLGDFTLLDNIGPFTSGPTCCQGDRCNVRPISLRTTTAAPTTTPQPTPTTPEPTPESTPTTPEPTTSTEQGKLPPLRLFRLKQKLLRQQRLLRKQQRKLLGQLRLARQKHQQLVRQQQLLDRLQLVQKGQQQLQRHLQGVRQQQRQLLRHQRRLRQQQQKLIRQLQVLCQ